MATYLDFVSDDEQALTLAEHLLKMTTKGKEDSTLLNSLEQSVKSGDMAAFWTKFLQIESLFSDVPEKELEGYFMTVASLLKKRGDDTIHKVIPTLISTMVANPEDKPLLRLRILTNTYNILGSTSPQDRYEIFLAILNFTVGLKRSETVLPFLTLESLDQRIKEWNLNPKQKSELYKITRDIHKRNKRSTEEHQWTIRYLSTLDSAEAVQEAVTAVQDAIGSPDLYEFDKLIEIPAVRNLEKTHGNLWELFQIFVSQNYQQFKSFREKHPDTIQSAGLDPEVLSTKMRLLTLATLAGKSGELPYSAVAEALDVSQDDVEMWVISAISENVLDARIDQLRNVVVVSRGLNRTFTMEQWKQLGENLGNWSKSLKDLLTTLKQAKQQQLTALQQQVA